MLQLIQRVTANERLMRRAGRLFGPFHPFLPEYRDNPHATWKHLRDHSPVYRSRMFGSWVFTRYDDVMQILRSPSFSADRAQMPVMKFVRYLNRKDPALLNTIERNLLMLEGAEHRRLRGLVSKAFTPRRVEQLRPRLEILADELLDRAAERDTIDLVSDFAYPFPVVAISELMGVPVADRDQIVSWSGKLVQLLDPFQGTGGAEAMRTANREMGEYFRGLFAQRRADPQADLMSAMIAAEHEGQKLDEADLLALASLLLIAGHETTANLISNAVVALLRNEGERKRLQEDPSLMSTAVDEFLRFDSPIVLTDRLAIEDCEVGGQKIRAGQMAVAGLAAANRDPAQFEDPDRLDVGRTDNAHVSFSQGAHFCLGAQLARLEAEIAISALLRRFPHFSGPIDPPSWRRSMVLRGPEALPIQLAGG